MPPKRTATVMARLDVLPFATPAEDLTWVRCVHCKSPLDLLQPEVQFPERLLGICEECSSWYFIQLVLERSEVIMLQIPEQRSLREGAE